MITSSQKSAGLYFRVGEQVVDTGIYRVFHSRHRVSHEVTLLAGHLFPRCSECKNDVQFELLRSAPEIIRDTSFRISLYEIPHPTEQAPLQSDEMSV